MPSFRWNRRALIVIIFGIVTAVLWILCIWQLVLRFKTETSSPSPAPLLCNKGEYRDGVCFCPEEWTGQHCETANFCEDSTYVVNSSKKFTFTRIVVDRFGYSAEKCENHTVNAGTPEASRKCFRIKGRLTLAAVTFVKCNSSLKTLMDELRTTDNVSSIASNTQILTSVPEKLTTENISTAADIAGQILKNDSQEANATMAAVATVSQLLDARVSEFNFADENLTNTTANLTRTLENFSLNGSAVQPNIAVQHISFKTNSTKAWFSAKTVSGSLLSENIKVSEKVPDIKDVSNSEVQILINITKNDRCLPHSVNRKDAQKDNIKVVFIKHRSVIS